MSISELAAALGSRGGLARAARLSPDRRQQIAAAGAAARRRSLDAARRIDVNFSYASAVEALRGMPPAVRRVSTCRNRLPGIYPGRDGA
ncbi:MAG: hypothetical protein M3Q55_06980 [Acidobacteriota bacterium]|nr:hypothetical protein [Acidobacteriota bacterium]